jgi:trimethylamine--corrinoid protein Co-methyltransferase
VVFNLGFTHTMDMRQAVTRTGGPENGMLHAAGAQLAAYHDLPSAAWMSTESMAADEQAAYEKMTTGLMQALGGVNIIWGIGQLESQRTMSLEQMVIDNEIAGVCLRASKPIATDDDSLAYDLIAEMGYEPDYLGHEHTLSRFRSALFETELGFVGWRESWQNAGAKTAIERAHDRVVDILAADPTPHVDEDTLRELLAIEARWRTELA